MEYQILYARAADFILLVHALVALFIGLGLVFIFVGKLLFWSWVRNPWFRSAHLLAIGVVVIQSWFGAICPLTTWEMDLRSKAGETVYEGSFIAYWLHSLLYYDAPPWVFVVCYTVFGLLVTASWVYVRPRPLAQDSRRDDS